MCNEQTASSVYVALEFGTQAPSSSLPANMIHIEIGEWWVNVHLESTGEWWGGEGIETARGDAG